MSDRTHLDDELHVRDVELRAMMNRAGFNVVVTGDVDAFAKFMRFMYADYEQQTRSRDTRRTVLIALGVGLTTTLIPLILKFLKVI